MQHPIEARNQVEFPAEDGRRHILGANLHTFIQQFAAGQHAAAAGIARAARRSLPSLTPRMGVDQR